jgi:hypothetical protein
MSHLDTAYKLGSNAALEAFGREVLANDATRTSNTLAGGASGLYVGQELRPVLAKLKGKGSAGALARAIAPYVGLGLGGVGAGLGHASGG